MFELTFDIERLLSNSWMKRVHCLGLAGFVVRSERPNGRKAVPNGPEAVPRS